LTLACVAVYLRVGIPLRVDRAKAPSPPPLSSNPHRIMVQFDASLLQHSYDDDAPRGPSDEFNPENREEVIAMMKDLADDDPFRSEDEVEYIEDVMHNELSAESSERDHCRKYLQRQREIHRML
jgi:hypothetical protein